MIAFSPLSQLLYEPSGPPSLRVTSPSFLPLSNRMGPGFPVSMYFTYFRLPLANMVPFLANRSIGIIPATTRNAVSVRATSLHC